jgi:hypothetical protein
MVCKVSQGWQFYYLLPVSGLSGVALILIILCMRQIFYGHKSGLTDVLTAQRFKHVIFNLDSRLLLLIVILFLFYIRKDEIRSVCIWKSQEKSQFLSVHVMAENEYKDYAKVYYLSSSSPAFALRLGSDPSYAVNYDDIVKESNSEIFKKLYPDIYFYNIFKGTFSNWDNEIPFEKLLSRYSNKIIFQGPRFEELFSRFTADSKKRLVKPHLLLRDILKGEDGGHSRGTIYEFAISKKNGLEALN